MPGKTLIVVESPAKAKTIEKILDRTYEVRASKGHVADLPDRSLGVDVDNEFTPAYEIKKDKRAVINELKRAAKSAGRVILATDHDREGEAIGWHIARLLELEPGAVLRAHFHEITPRAVSEALKNPGHIDQDLVDAQQARRVLDRLVGYNLSPLLTEKFRQRSLSAGRVQSVALRVVVEREIEIEAFVPVEYWTLSGRFDANVLFTTELYTIGKERILDKNKERFLITSEAQAREIEAQIKAVPAWSVASVEKRERSRRPSPPFTTSTMQQAAGGRLGWTASRTMRVAQRLYEGMDLPEGTVGLITYMRTDSVRISGEAIKDARDFIPKTFGKAYLPTKPNFYTGRKSGVQDAHEAIRPTSVARTPEAVQKHLQPEELKLYQLIWSRFVASQMTPARYDQTTVTVKGGIYTFRVSGSILRFDGYLKAWGREGDEAENLLPEIREGAAATMAGLSGEQHSTQPPPRYNDASLVKALEEMGIGRPSTYAPTIDTLERRSYIERQGRALEPTPLGRKVVGFLLEHFPRVVAYEFTAQMEDHLDEVEAGKIHWPGVVREFYKLFMEEYQQVPRKTCPVCGRPLELKVGRFGQFLGCSGYPECKYTEPLVEKRPPEPTGEACPLCGNPLVRKWGRYGSFIACSGYPACDYTRDEAPSTGFTCPKCKEGEVVIKKSRRGKPYYRCNRKGCDFITFDPLVEEKCELCDWNLMERGRAKKRVCSNPSCVNYGGPDLSKPATAKGGRAKGGRKVAGRGAMAKKRSASPKATWADLKPHLNRLETVESRLIRALEDEHKSLEEAARNLGVALEEARGLQKKAIFKLRMAYGRAKKAEA